MDVKFCQLEELNYYCEEQLSIYMRKAEYTPDEPDNWRTYNEPYPSCPDLDYQKEYSKQGYARHDTWLLAKKSRQNDYRQVLHHYKNKCPWIEVTASKQGIPLGRAKVDIWDWEYVQETIIAYDMIELAIADAELNLKQLCTCSQ